MRKLAIIILALAAMASYSHGFDFDTLDPRDGLFDCKFVSDKNSTITQYCKIHETMGYGHKKGYVAVVESYIRDSKVVEVRVYVYKNEDNSFRNTGIFQVCDYQKRYEYEGIREIACRCFEQYGSTSVQTRTIFYGPRELSTYLKSND